MVMLFNIVLNMMNICYLFIYLCKIF